LAPLPSQHSKFFQTKSATLFRASLIELAEVGALHLPFRCEIHVGELDWQIQPSLVENDPTITTKVDPVLVIVGHNPLPSHFLSLIRELEE
jgi:hypothetical protein